MITPVATSLPASKEDPIFPSSHVPVFNAVVSAITKQMFSQGLFGSPHPLAHGMQE